MLIIDAIFYAPTGAVFGTLDSATRSVLRKYIDLGADSSGVTHSDVTLDAPDLSSIRAAVCTGLQALFPERSYAIEHVDEMDDLYTTWPVCDQRRAHAGIEKCARGHCWREGAPRCGQSAAPCLLLRAADVRSANDAAAPEGQP